MRIALALLVLALAGCTPGLRSDAPVTQMYVLRAAPAMGLAEAERIPASLQITAPSPGPGLESERIVLVQADRRMSYFAASRWPAQLPRVVEALAVQAFRATGALGAVLDARTPFPPDYFLEASIRHFEADYASGGEAPEVRVVLDCIVGRRDGRELLASFTAAGTARAQANRMSDVIAAFEAASNAALGTVVARTLAAIRTSTGPSPP